MSSYHGTEDILYIPHNVQNFSSFFVKLQIIDYFEVCEIDVMKCVLSLVDLAIFSGVVVHLNCFIYNSTCMNFNNRNSTCIHKVPWYITVVLVQERECGWHIEKVKYLYNIRGEHLPKGKIVM